jgi:hypothetical protein
MPSGPWEGSNDAKKYATCGIDAAKKTANAIQKKYFMMVSSSLRRITPYTLNIKKVPTA